MPIDLQFGQFAQWDKGIGHSVNGSTIHIADLLLGLPAKTEQGNVERIVLSGLQEIFDSG